MLEWYWILLIVAGIIGILLAIEDTRDMIVDGFEYVISFEWLSDFWDIISGAFEDIGDISFWGLGLGAIGVGIIFVFREKMLYSFLNYMSPMEKIIWGGATYVIVFVAGYFIGKGFENS